MHFVSRKMNRENEISKKVVNPPVKLKNPYKNQHQHSKLVMKQKTSGRKSMSQIHCIPKFSQVMPSKHMSVAQKALQQKIKSRKTDNADTEDSFDRDSNYFGLLNNAVFENNSCKFQVPELTIKPIVKKLENKSYESGKETSKSMEVPELTIIPKYPQLLQTDTIPKFISKEEIESSMRFLILNKDDFERVLYMNPVFSTYIFLPKLNVFVHPLVVPNPFSLFSSDSLFSKR